MPADRSKPLTLTCHLAHVLRGDDPIPRMAELYVTTVAHLNVESLAQLRAALETELTAGRVRGPDYLHALIDEAWTDAALDAVSRWSAPLRQFSILRPHALRLYPQPTRPYNRLPLRLIFTFPDSARVAALNTARESASMAGPIMLLARYMGAFTVSQWQRTGWAGAPALPYIEFTLSGNATAAEWRAECRAALRLGEVYSELTGERLPSVTDEWLAAARDAIDAAPVYRWVRQAVRPDKRVNRLARVRIGFHPANIDPQSL